MDQTLADYIKKCRELGRGDEEIKALLLNSGHDASDVDAIFKQIDSPDPLPPPPPPMPSPPPPRRQPMDQVVNYGQPQTGSSIPGPITLLNQALRLYRQRWTTLLGIGAISTLISMVLLLLYGTPAVVGALSGIPILLIVLAIFGYLFVIMMFLWGITAQISAIKYSQENIGIVESYRRGWASTSSYLWASILAGLVTLGGFALLIVPGIIFGVWFLFAGIVAVAEGLTGMNALLKSKEYVRGRWGSVFSKYLFIFIVSIFVYLISYLTNMFLGPSVISTVVSSVLTLLFMPLWWAYIFLLYSYLKSARGEFSFSPSAGQKASFGIIAVVGPICLAVVMFYTITVILNPSDLLAQARDGQRISDLDSMSASIVTYLAQVQGNPNLDALKVSPNGICSYAPDSGYAPFAGGNCKVITSQAIDGTGWIDINFNSLPAGGLLASLYVDPVNNGKYFFAYKADTANDTFELYARLESPKFQSLMAGEGRMVDVTTGGPCVSYSDPTCWYEVGTLQQNEQGTSIQAPTPASNQSQGVKTGTQATGVSGSGGVAELLAEARDGQRMSDMDTVQAAITTYLAEVQGTPSLNVQNVLNGICSGKPSAGQSPFNSGNCKVITSTAVDGSGWVDINFNTLQGGSPLFKLPLDPVNNGTYFYAYKGNDTATNPNYTFKLETHLESTKFASKEICGLASNSTVTATPADEASPNCWYQVGTNLSL